MRLIQCSINNGCNQTQILVTDEMAARIKPHSDLLIPVLLTSTYSHPAQIAYVMVRVENQQ